MNNLLIFQTWASSRETYDLVMMSVTNASNHLSLFPLQKFQTQGGKLDSQLRKKRTDTNDNTKANYTIIAKWSGTFRSLNSN